MALGATLKVKMDTSAVSRGLSGMKAKVGKAFGAIKKIGLAAFGAIAAAAAGLAAAAVSATNFVRSVEMVALQTGMTTKEVLDLQHAFSLVRIDAEGAADVMSEFQKRLGEARMGQGEAIIGLQKLGIAISSLEGLSTMEAFERILTAVKTEALDGWDAVLAMDKMFGSKGFELLRLAKDYKALMASARKETEGLASQFSDTSKFQGFERSMAKASLLAREIQMRLVSALPLDKIEEAMNKVDFTGLFDRLGVEFNEFMDRPMAKMIEWGITIGKAVGEGIIVGAVQFMSSKEGMKFLVQNLTLPGKIWKEAGGVIDRDEKRAETETPEERRERQSKFRLNVPLLREAMKLFFGWGRQQQDGPTSRVNTDLLDEVKDQTVVLRRIEGASPSFA